MHSFGLGPLISPLDVNLSDTEMSKQ